MKHSRQRLFKQVAEMAEKGKLGDSIKAARKEYAQFPAGIAVFLKCVIDAYEKKERINAEITEIAELRDLFAQLIIVAYREAAVVDEETALALIHSLIDDYPGVSESCLAPQFVSLMQAALAFREVAYSSNVLLAWQQMSRLVLSYNEFLNALLGFMVPCLCCMKGKRPDPNVFSAPYSSRIDQINSLTGGENGAFYIFTRLARPRLRNAIAHGTIWLDSEAAKVRYTEGNKNKQEYEMDLTEFVGLAMIGSHLVEPYLAAMATIVVMEAGSDLAKSLLSKHLVRVFTFKKEKA